MAAILGKNISFSYSFNEDLLALDDICLEIKKGELCVFLGQNGSGKSTLAKHINALLPLQEGELWVNGINAAEEKNIRELRRCCGFVFQNPDNQFVSSIIEEDIAFGLENFMFPRDLIKKRVKTALAMVGMEGFEKRSVNTLSGGQKQRIALAGILAIEPEIIIFDEVTSMLDPQGKKEIMEIIEDLHKAQKHTLLMITHYSSEAIFADRICLMKDGKIIAQDNARAVLSDYELLTSCGVTPPLTVCLYRDLKKAGIVLKNCPLTGKEFAEEICRLN